MSTDPEVEYLTPAEAGRVAFLSVRQLARLADAGRIGFIRPGRHRRYLRSDVEALAQGGTSRQERRSE